MNPLRFLVLTTAAAVLAACNPSESSPTPEPAPEPEPEVDAAVPDAEVEVPDEPEGSFTLTLDTDKLPILQGTSEELVVTVERKNGFAEAIRLSAIGLPQGVSMAEVTIAADDDEATVELRAPESAPHSLPTAVKIKGTAMSANAERSLTVTVYGPPGSLDTSFAGGKVVVPVGRSDDYARAMAVAADGKIILAGQRYENAGDFTLLRLSRDGDVDTAFGEEGVVATQVGSGADIAYAVGVQKDGKIVAAGSTAVGSTDLDFGLVRYNEDGSLDESFGDGGIVITKFGADSDVPYALVIQDDGKIVLGGTSNQGSSGTGQDFALARYNSDGSLDDSFGEGGKVVTPITSSSGGDIVYALALMEVEGETMILAAGGEGDFKAARYHEDGSLDLTFGEGGKIDGMVGSTIGTARAIAPTANGEIVLAGHHTHDFTVVRLLEDGSPDVSFGEAGVAITKVSETNWDEAKGLALEADGKIVVGGWVYEGVGTSGNFALVRYTEDGGLDTEFGEGGIVVTEMSAPQRRDEGSAVLLQSDERVPAVRVLLAGSASASNSDFAVSRYWR